MNTLPKTLAAFGAGIASWESIVHLSLLANRQSPRLFGIRLSPRVNLVQTIVPAVAAIALAAYVIVRTNREAWKLPSLNGARGRSTGKTSIPVAQHAT